MQPQHMLKLLFVNALLLGALLVAPMPARAEGAGGGSIIDLNTVDTNVVANQLGEIDTLVLEESDEDDEDAAAGSSGQPEYKYISIRRF